MDRQRLQPVGRGAEEFDRAGPHADTHFLDRPRARDETGLREGHVARLEHQLVSAATDTIDDEAVADLHRGEPAGPGGEDEQRADRKSTPSELQSLMRISYAVFCLKKTKKHCNT